jgi:transposase
MAESNRQRRFFPDAFKLEAAAAVRGGRSVSSVAAELGLPDRLVRGWLRWAEGRAAAGSGGGGGGGRQKTKKGEDPPPPRRVGPSPADQAAEIARLRRENDRLRMERDILKQAALIFGQATGRR